MSSLDDNGRWLGELVKLQNKNGQKQGPKKGTTPTSAAHQLPFICSKRTKENKSKTTHDRKRHEKSTFENTASRYLAQN